MKHLGRLAGIPLFASLFFLFVGERILDEGTASAVFDIIGVLLLAGALGLRFYARSQAKGPAGSVETILLIGYGGVALSMFLYLLQTEWALDTMGLGGTAAERTDGTLEALWPAVLVTALTAVVFAEFAYFKMPIAEAVELRRVRDAALGGKSIALALVFLFSMNYVAYKKDEKKDLSYFQTTKPSDGTLRMVKKLGEKIDILLFFPKVNEVLEQAQPYFTAIDKASPKLSLKVKDHALVPKLASQHKVQGNGYAVLLKGEGKGQQAEKFQIGTTLEEARNNLKKLDGRFQKALAALAQRRRELYFTAGHDERSASGIDGDGPGLRISELKTALERSNIRMETLGMAQGLSNDVPKKAPAVAVVGPRTPFLPEEAQSLLRYVKGGGRLMVMLDPGVEHGLEPLLEGLGLEVLPGTVCSEKQHLRRKFNASDKGIVFANKYSSHPTVTVASRNSSRVASIFLEGVALKRKPGNEITKKLTVVFPIKSAAGFFRDLNGNYTQDAGEAAEQLNMMAAVAVPTPGKEDGRAVIIGDGDFITDQLIRSPGNAFVLSDMMRWLIGEEQIVGDTTTEEDVKIEHTKEEDKIWFYATSFGAPVPLLGLGVWMAMRRRRRKVSKPKQSSPGSASGPVATA